MLVGTDGYMPPFGALGQIVEPMDEDGDYGVLFFAHPCPNPPGIHWYAPPSWLMPIDGNEKQTETVATNQRGGD
jgi:hypothetical protein